MVEDARGTGRRKVGAAEVEAKFRDTAGQVLPAQNVERLIEMIGRLETLASLEPLLAGARIPV
jgi:hemolysin activation/secretion protein